jgi:hypothetical protein
MRLNPEALLQIRGATVHNTGADDRMTLKLDSQGFQEGIPL